MNEFIEKWASAALGALSVGLMVQAILLWANVRSLQQYHDREWPLERQLLTFELAQLEARIEINEQNIMINDENLEDIRLEVRSRRP